MALAMPVVQPATTMPMGLVMAAEALSARDMVNVFLDAGVSKVRKADASVWTKPADGFVLQSAGVGDMVVVHSIGAVPGFTGLTPTAYYNLSDTVPGGVTGTAVAGPGKLGQTVGQAVSSTTLFFTRGMPMRLN